MSSQKLPRDPKVTAKPAPRDPKSLEGSAGDAQVVSKGPQKVSNGSSRDAKVIPRWSSGLPKELPGTFREAQVVLRGAQGFFFTKH